MNITISKETEINKLMAWRMKMLSSVSDKEMDIEALTENSRCYFEQHIADESHIACIAYIGIEAVGCGGVCFYDEMPTIHNPDGKCAYLTDIYVSEEYRDNGIGKRILRWLVGQALAKGIQKIYLESTPESHNLFGNSGFNYMKDLMQLETK